MAEYELRLLNKRGSAILIHKTICMDDERARDVLMNFKDIPYVHFEIWRGTQKVADGARPAA